MKDHPDSPRVYIPPPLLYAATFFAGVAVQRAIPLNRSFFHSQPSRILGMATIAVSFFFIFPALRQFFKTKNTVVTIKPASSLETTGIYAVTRNPMYVSLVLVYTGISFIFGGWWNLILLPLLILIVQEYVIKREEKYLDRAFGEAYANYKTRVRRWL